MAAKCPCKQELWEYKSVRGFPNFEAFLNVNPRVTSKACQFILQHTSCVTEVTNIVIYRLPSATWDISCTQMHCYPELFSKIPRAAIFHVTIILSNIVAIQDIISKIIKIFHKRFKNALKYTGITLTLHYVTKQIFVLHYKDKLSYSCCGRFRQFKINQKTNTGLYISELDSCFKSFMSGYSQSSWDEYSPRSTYCECFENDPHQNLLLSPQFELGGWAMPLSIASGWQPSTTNPRPWIYSEINNTNVPNVHNYEAGSTESDILIFCHIPELVE